jgi:hypothetical protein
MKTTLLGSPLHISAWCLTLLLAANALAQNYSIDWFTVDGGGGTSTGGVFSLSGTIGQPDAGHLGGGDFALDGGFWGIRPGRRFLGNDRSGSNARRAAADDPAHQHKHRGRLLALAFDRFHSPAKY